MTSRAAFTFRVNANIQGALGELRRLEGEARATARQLNNVSGGLAGRGIGGTARGIGAGARTIGAGAGLGAGIVIIEQLFERLFELFEDTPILEQFISVAEELFRAAAPLVGVLLHALLPVIQALTPAIAPLVEALAPLIELLGGALLVTVKLLTPLLIEMARAIEIVVTALRDAVFFIIRRVVGTLNRIPGVNIDLPDLQQDTLGESRRQLEESRRRAEAEERQMSRAGTGGDSRTFDSPIPRELVAPITIVIGNDIIQRETRRQSLRDRDLGRPNG